MGRLADDTIHAMLGARFGNRALPAIATYYVHLSVADLDDDGSGAVYPDPTQGYGPAPLPNDSTHWAVPSGRAVTQSADVFFPVSKATALGGQGWGTVVAYLVFDGADVTTANLIGWGSMPAQIVTAGTALRLPAGTVTITSPLPA